MLLNDFLVFIYESGICLAVLFLMYWLFLRRETYFHFNRFYLLSIILVAFALPLINLGIFESSNELSPLGGISGIADTIRTPAVSMYHASENLPNASYDWRNIALAVYLIGASLLFARIILGIIRIEMLRRKGRRISLDGYSIVYTQQTISPFSFFRTIFLHDSLPDGPDDSYIINHEIIHIKQLHTYDKLLVELFLAVFWFNPFMWFLKGALRDNHEYLADNGVLNQKVNPTVYQTLLLKQTIGLAPISLASTFNSAIKNRIIMMCKNKSSLIAKFKPLLLVPIIATLFLIFACNEKTNGQTVTDSQSELIQENQSTAHQVMPPEEVLELNFPDEMILIEKEPGEESMEADGGPQDTIKTIEAKGENKQEPKSENTEVFYVVEDMPTFNGGDPATEFRIFIAQNLQYPESAARDSISGRVIVQFAINTEGKLVDPVVVRKSSPALDNEAIRVVSASPLWTPGKQRGKEVKVLFTFPINFVIQ